MTIQTLSLLLLVAITMTVNADMFLQNMRGSNNRLNGNNRDRQNANRLFDSQNNARGGYNVGGLGYYVGSVLSLEWTNQHSCGGPNNKCDIIIQYMCSDTLRNGRQETTIPFPRFASQQNQNQGCFKNNCNKDRRFGMHEDYQYYQHCLTRKRNFGVYTSDQNLDNKNRAIFTRQDNGGTRYGYECPEERDYYPYWHPTPWKDIIVLTNDVSRCDYYKQQSQNVANKSHCVLPGIDSLPRNILKDLPKNFNNNSIPQTEEECKKYRREFENGSPNKTVLNGSWEKVPAHGIPAPDCQKAPKSRDNHNGNGIGGHPNTYDWTIPDDVQGHCSLRIRYNISTGEFPFNTDSESNGRNKKGKPCKACAINLGDQLGIDEWDAQDRGYILTGNPDIKPMSINGKIQEKFELKLAINTDQYGRTFQDRSHTFAILQRPANIPSGAKIYNLNVRGKRGNIVQTYPATEYDYVPTTLKVEQNDYVHIQWTGSDDNPQNNAGQGQAGTDRSNIVQLKPQQFGVVNNASGIKHGHLTNSYPDNVKKTNFLGFSYEDEVSLALSGAPHWGGDLDELDEANINYNLGLRQCKAHGEYRFMCTRNNNFTNRGQKGVIVVKEKNKKDENNRYKSLDQYDKEMNDIEKAKVRQQMMSS